MAIRDRRYLNWRFASRPDSPYTILAALRDSSTLGYLVLRVIDHLGVPCGFLIDYLVEDRKLFSLLLKEVEELLRDGRVKAIVCSVATAPFRSLLFRQGFFPIPFRKRSYLSAWLNSADPGLEVFADLP